MITQNERHLIFKFTGGDDKLLPVAHKINQFVYSEAIFNWLVSKQLIGNTFVDWFGQVHGNNLQNMVKFIVNQQRKLR